MCCPSSAPWALGLAQPLPLQDLWAPAQQPSCLTPISNVPPEPNFCPSSRGPRGTWTCPTGTGRHLHKVRDDFLVLGHRSEQQLKFPEDFRVKLSNASVCAHVMPRNPKREATDAQWVRLNQTTVKMCSNTAGFCQAMPGNFQWHSREHTRQRHFLNALEAAPPMRARSSDGILTSPT